MPSDVEQLARLRVARDLGRLPRDLADWLIERIDIPPSERLRTRVHALQAAADLLPGSRWAKASELQRLIHGAQSEDLDLPLRAEGKQSPAGLVRYALSVDPGCPTSIKQLLRIIA